ncbi:MAG: hypothetical protein FWG77_03360 [Treponema sp.]|nr:hypothetical protein [Treponema sp.]
MDWAQAVYILSRLIPGTLASFLAIMLWPGTRDIAWMLIILGTIAAYVESIYIIIGRIGLIDTHFILSVLLGVLPVTLIIAALFVMVLRKYRHR